jgi:APA family basic amino acid/polyamine antiporter
MSYNSVPDGDPSLQRVLGWVGYFTLSWGSIVGVGWIVLMDDWLRRGGPIGAALGFFLGGVLLVPIAVVYGRMMALAPVSGGEFVFLEGLAPRILRFWVGWIMLLAYLIVCPFEAVAVGQLAEYILPELLALPLYRIGTYVVTLPELLLAVAVVAGVTLANLWGLRPSVRLQTLLTFVLLSGVIAFVVAGSARCQFDNWIPLFPRPDVLGGAITLLLMLQVVPYFLAGFESVARYPDERRGSFSPSRFVSITIVALGVAVAFYIALILVTAGLQPWSELKELHYATLNAFRTAFGSASVVNILIVLAIISLVKVLNGCFVAATRQVYALARAGMLPASLATLHPRSNVPLPATLSLGILCAACSLLGKAVLVPIAEVGSMAFTVGWLAACAAYSYLMSRQGHSWWLGACGVVVAGVFLSLKLIPWAPGSLSSIEYGALVGWLAIGTCVYLLSITTSKPV